MLRRNVGKRGPYLFYNHRARGEHAKFASILYVPRALRGSNQIFADVKCAAPQVVRQRVFTLNSPTKASTASAAKITKPI